MYDLSRNKLQVIFGRLSDCESRPPKLFGNYILDDSGFQSVSEEPVKIRSRIDAWFDPQDHKELRELKPGESKIVELEIEGGDFGPIMVQVNRSTEKI